MFFIDANVGTSVGQDGKILRYTSSIQLQARWSESPEQFSGQLMVDQICHGSFEGNANLLGTLSLNLNPGMIDNNVLLECSLRLPYRIDGQWNYIGFPGVIN